LTGVIFIVDSSDVDRLPEAKIELQTLLTDPNLENIPMLLLANKQDLSTSLNVAQLTSALNLQQSAKRPWHVQSCVATTGMGIHEGLDWLMQTLRE
jgi:signal recognition particle receptor subunit beta